VHETLSIPPDLDRALAMTVLETVRAPASAAAAGGGREGAPPSRLDSILEQVVRALVTAGATSDEVLDALHDAFAALLAARPGDHARDIMLALDAHAQATARRLLVRA
jgi:hypothetical protein